MVFETRHIDLLIAFEASMCSTYRNVNLTTDTVVKSEIMNAHNLQKELVKIGLSPNQANIYSLLVTHKEMRIQEIAKLAKIPRSSVYENLRGLFELGIVEEIVEDNYKKIRPYSIGAMHHGLDEKMLELQRLSKDLRELEKTIALSNLPDLISSTVVRYYTGRSGARQLYWNSLKAQDTVYIMSDWGRGRYVGMKYYERFVDESRKREVRERVLINPTVLNLESIKKYADPGSPLSRTRVEDTRTLDKKIIPIKGDTLIYDNIYSQVYLKN